MTALADNLIHRVNVGDTLSRTAARHPARTAIVDGDRSWTYREFDTWVNRLARGLGYARGDALALASGNSAEFLAVYYACAKLGVVCVPINLGWRPEEVRYVLEHSRARGAVVEAQLLDTLGNVVSDLSEVIVAPGTGGDARGYPRLEQRAADDGSEPEVLVADRDPISYLYTSGTTSAPKGVVGHHTGIVVESMMMALECKFDETDRFAAVLPMFHTAQLNCHCTPAVLVGATIHVLRAFDAGELLGLVERERLTQIFGLPMMYRAMLDHPAMAGTDVSSLRRACYAMAPMPDKQLREAIERFDCDFYLLFGQTEMSPTATIFRPEHQLSHAGAVGTPAATVSLGVMSEDGRLLPRGERGEIVYRSPHAMTEYFNDPEATEAVFAHGWFHSGDSGYVDDDGILWFSDRFKDVIKTGGENVASLEVERAVYAADPRVAEAVVVGLPHERWSEAITAVVVAREGETIDEAGLLDAIGTDLEAYKVPKSVIVTAELPKTSTGKVQKNRVREQHRDHYGGEPG